MEGPLEVSQRRANMQLLRQTELFTVAATSASTHLKQRAHRAATFRVERPPFQDINRVQLLAPSVISEETALRVPKGDGCFCSAESDSPPSSEVLYFGLEFIEGTLMRPLIRQEKHSILPEGP